MPRLPHYQRQVGPAEPSPIIEPAQESSYEGIIQVSEALWQAGGRVFEVARDQERRLRDRTMRAEAAKAQRKYNEWKNQFFQQHFAPDTAHIIDEGHTEPRYVRGKRKLREEADAAFPNITDHFTYSDARDAFVQQYELDLESFDHELQIEGRGLLLQELQSEFEAEVEEFTRLRDTSGLRDAIDSAMHDGLITRQQAQDIGDSALRNIAERNILDDARSAMRNTNDINVVADAIYEHQDRNFTDYSGETRRVETEVLDGFFNQLNQELWAQRRHDDWEISQADDQGNDQAQRMWQNRDYRGLRAFLDLDQSESGLTWQSRQRWLQKLDAMQAAEEAEAGGLIDKIHEDELEWKLLLMLDQGANPNHVEDYVMDLMRNRLISPDTYQSLGRLIRNADNSPVYELQRDARDTISREMRKINPQVDDMHIRAAIREWEEHLNAINMFEYDPETFEVTGFGPQLSNMSFDESIEHLEKAARAFARNAANPKRWSEFTDELRTARAEGEVPLYLMEQGYHLGIPVTPELTEFLIQTEHHYGELFRDTFDVDVTQTGKDPHSKRPVYAVSVPPERRPGHPMAVPPDRQYVFTPVITKAERDEEGNVTDLEMRWHMWDGQAWQRIETEAEMDRIRQMLGGRTGVEQQTDRVREWAFGATPASGGGWTLSLPPTRGQEPESPPETPQPDEGLRERVQDPTWGPR